MIASYMDESFDTAKGGVFAVGGLLGRGVPLFELERKWKALRDQPDIGIGYFKASECESGIGEFAKFVANHRSISAPERDRLREISQAFLKLISTEDVIVQGIGIVQSDFYDVITDPRVSRLSWKWRERSAVKITERTREKATEALHRRREGRYPQAAFAGTGTGLKAV
jgi:hypothetical protein